jgi:restriction system protein
MADFFINVAAILVGLIVVVGGGMLLLMSSSEGGLGRFFATPEGERKAAAEKSAVESAAIETTRAHVSEHLSALVRQRRLLVSKNAYGIENTTKWDAEISMFMRSIISPALNLESERTFYLEEERERLLGLCEIEVRASTEAGFVDSGAAFAQQYDAEMSPIEFEHFCAERMRRDGWDATVTQAASDQGADIIARCKHSSIAIQCKQYSKPVGNSAVQEVVAARAHYETDHAAVIANIGFTPAARRLATSNGVHLIHHDEIGDLAILGPKKSR